MEFARQEYFWLLLVVPFVILLWGIGVWHQRRMRIRFGNIDNLESISRISWSGRAWFRGLLFVGALTLMAVGLAYPRAIVRELRAVPPTRWTSATVPSETNQRESRPVAAVTGLLAVTRSSRAVRSVLAARPGRRTSWCGDERLRLWWARTLVRLGMAACWVQAGRSV